MSKQAKERASRMREFTDCDQEYRETKSKDALERRFAAMRKGTSEDFGRSVMNVVERSAHEQRAKQEKLRREYGFSGWRKKEKVGHGQRDNDNQRSDSDPGDH